MSTGWTRKNGRTRSLCFGPALPRRGPRSRGRSRRFLEALHFFDSRERPVALFQAPSALEQRIGNALTGSARAGVFEAFFDALASMKFVRASDPDVRLDDCARACVGRWGKGGKKAKALGRSLQRAFTTKIHAKSDAAGDIIAFDLTGGEASDARHFDILLDIGPDIQPRAVICDKAYSARPIAKRRGRAASLRSSRHKANERDKPALLSPRPSHKARSRIEQGIGRLKRFKRVALRCEKTARNFRSIVSSRCRRFA